MTLFTPTKLEALVYEWAARVFVSSNVQGEHFVSGEHFVIETMLAPPTTSPWTSHLLVPHRKGVMSKSHHKGATHTGHPHPPHLICCLMSPRGRSVTSKPMYLSCWYCPAHQHAHKSSKYLQEEARRLACFERTKISFTVVFMAISLRAARSGPFTKRLTADLGDSFFSCALTFALDLLDTMRHCCKLTSATNASRSCE
eukprot:CAMPEP_0205883348 /NCGR_PEP_ID=MMETSP1083-20121108/17490_1 /ASSEMBLY_ACC=CAM_ASM_000430 /TAXON_ID=97485 /ORGANISM="Prymnesium parvum, Strain Texoma1" /LENGTH=198 /DNA_ID=CAMNT_0053246583 /DNA_START=110 /DNA_END=707 /DNA_ORIENTATION=-